jgi:hypothetical protein
MRSDTEPRRSRSALPAYLFQHYVLGLPKSKLPIAPGEQPACVMASHPARIGDGQLGRAFVVAGASSRSASHSRWGVGLQFVRPRSAHGRSNIYPRRPQPLARGARTRRHAGHAPRCSCSWFPAGVDRRGSLVCRRALESAPAATASCRASLVRPPVNGATCARPRRPVVARPPAPRRGTQALRARTGPRLGHRRVERPA